MFQGRGNNQRVLLITFKLFHLGWLSYFYDIYHGCIVLLHHYLDINDGIITSGVRIVGNVDTCQVCVKAEFRRLMANLLNKVIILILVVVYRCFSIGIMILQVVIRENIVHIIKFGAQIKVLLEKRCILRQYQIKHAVLLQDLFDARIGLRVDNNETLFQ